MAINHTNETSSVPTQSFRILPNSQSSHTVNNKDISSGPIDHVKTELNYETDIHVKQAIEKIQETVNNLARNLHFSIDEDTGKTVVKVMDMQTQEVIRQIPSQEAISIARALDKVQGLLLNDKA